MPEVTYHLAKQAIYALILAWCGVSTPQRSATEVLPAPGQLEATIHQRLPGNGLFGALLLLTDLVCLSV